MSEFRDRMYDGHRMLFSSYLMQLNIHVSTMRMNGEV